MRNYVSFFFLSFYLLWSSFEPCESKSWIWQGALMANSIRFRAKTDELEFRLVAVSNSENSSVVFARVITEAEFVDVAFQETNTDWNNNSTRVIDLVFEDLKQDTTYTWSATGGLEGRFHTPKKSGSPFNFTFAFASCADNDSNHNLFSFIPTHLDPLFFVHLGDLHYGNLHENNILHYSRMLDRTLTQVNQASLFHNLPTVYMWDDHDYGPNNADKWNPGRPAAMKMYRMFVPSYQLGTKNSEGPVYHSFIIGRVLFVVTDTSSERDPQNETTLGDEQLTWFLEKLRFIYKKPEYYIIWVK